jgi:hypothetical protein
VGEEDWMKKVVHFTDTEKVKQAFENFNIESFKVQKYPFKLHMGELKNKYFPKPEVVKPFINELLSIDSKPFFYDTTVAYPGPRHYKAGYKRVAKIHGYHKLGCEIVIDDKGKTVKIEGRDFEVGETLQKSSHIVAFSHVKGHIATGMGAAIKNFGMGGVTKENKRSMHHASRPIHKKDKCTYCGVCAEVCPFDALTVKQNKWKLSKRKCFGCGVCVENCPEGGLINEDKDLQFLLACATLACVKDKNVIYINDVNRIADSCDCDPLAKKILCPDIGFLVSDDPIAIDKASLDLINDVKEDVFKKENKVDPLKQIKYGEEIGLGSSSYQLIEI